MRRHELGPEESLALWDEFPVDARPRPIVLMGAAHGPPGFVSGELKEAFSHAQLVSEVELPPGLMERLRPYPKPHWQGNPLRIFSVRRVYREFRTDRGHRPFPAYQLEIEGALGPMVMIDPEVEATMWPPGVGTHVHGGGGGLPPVVLTGGGRRLDLIVIGSPPEYSWIVVTAVLETRTAVLVLTQQNLYARSQPVPLVAVGRHVTASLERPLGARVLIRVGGTPITVLPG